MLRCKTRLFLEFTKEKQGFVPEIILVSPAEIGEGITTSPFYGSFTESAVERSREFPEWFGKVAEKYGCIFVNAAKYIQPSMIDSVHLTPEGHAALADVLYKAVTDIKE